MERTFPVTIPPVINMPTFVSDGAELPAMLLAHTYIKEGLSEVDRLHTKCRDVGIKYLKRAFPASRFQKSIVVSTAFKERSTSLDILPVLPIGGLYTLLVHA